MGLGISITVCTSVISSLMDAIPSSASTIGLIACRVAGGFGVALAEGASFTLVCMHYDVWLARALSGIDVAIGLGCALSPWLAAELYVTGL